MRRSLPAVLEYYAARGLQPATILDVGVDAGTPELYDAFPDSRLVLVEPLQERRAHLLRLGAIRHVEVITAAAGPTAGSTQMLVHRVPALSSVIGDRPGDASPHQPRTVPVVRLDDVVREHRVEDPLVLKVDVEGAELSVLDGAQDVLKRAALVLLEVAFVELINGAPLFGEVVEYMRRRDFVVAELYNGHLRPLDGLLAQMDVAFLPANSPFRVGSGYGTVEQNDALYRTWGY